MWTITSYSHSGGWTLGRVRRHLWLGGRGTVGRLVTFLGQGGDVVDNFVLTTFLGGP